MRTRTDFGRPSAQRPAVCPAQDPNNQKIKDITMDAWHGSVASAHAAL